MIEGPAAARNVFDLERAARTRLGADDFAYLAGGADDMRTVRRNSAAFSEIGIRVRRLIDVRRIDTSVRVLGTSLPSPIVLAPVGFQAVFHPDGELATARAAATAGRLMIASTVSSRSIGEIAATAGGPVWFQLYPTPDRGLTRELLARAEEAGCPVVVPTVDVPAIGNREQGGETLQRMLAAGELTMGNLAGHHGPLALDDPGLTWDFVDWLRDHCRMKIVLKGIVTAEDAGLAVERGVDGLIVSNHGGRQEESDRATIECLPEVVDTVAGRLPVLLDGGIRRGTDVFKALAVGAVAACVGRPYCWGLAAFGSAGVERALELLDGELARIMRLAGTVSIERITRASIDVRRSGGAAPQPD